MIIKIQGEGNKPNLDPRKSPGGVDHNTADQKGKYEKPPEQFQGHRKSIEAVLWCPHNRPERYINDTKRKYLTKTENFY